MIHENSMSPESAIQGTAGEGPRGKTQLNMDKVRGGLETQIKHCSAFLCAFWSHRRSHFHIR